MAAVIYGTPPPPRIDDLTIWVDPANKKCTNINYETLYPRGEEPASIANTITCLKSGLTNLNNDSTKGFEARLGVVNAFHSKWHYSFGTGYNPPQSASNESTADFQYNPSTKHQYPTQPKSWASYSSGTYNFYGFTSPGHFQVPYPLVLPETSTSGSSMNEKGINAVDDLYFNNVNPNSSSDRKGFFSRPSKTSEAHGVSPEIDGNSNNEPGQLFPTSLNSSHGPAAGTQGSFKRLMTETVDRKFTSHSIPSFNSGFHLKVARNMPQLYATSPILFQRGGHYHTKVWDDNAPFSRPHENHIDLEGQIINLSTFNELDYVDFIADSDRENIGELFEVGPIIDSDSEYFYHGVRPANMQTGVTATRTDTPIPTWAFDAYRNPVLPLELDDALKENPFNKDPAPARMFTLTYAGVITSDHEEWDGNTSGGEYDYHNEIADVGTFNFWHGDAAVSSRDGNINTLFMHSEGDSPSDQAHGIYNDMFNKWATDRILLNKEDCDFNNPTVNDTIVPPRTLYIYKKSTGELMTIIRRSHDSSRLWGYDDKEYNTFPRAADGFATPNRDVQGCELTGFEAGENNIPGGDFRLLKMFRSSSGYNIGEEYVFVEMIDGYGRSGHSRKRNFMISPIKHHQPDFYPGAFRFFGSSISNSQNHNGKGIEFDYNILEPQQHDLRIFTISQWIRTNWQKGQQVTPATTHPVTGEDVINFKRVDGNTSSSRLMPYNEWDHMPTTFSIGEELMCFPAPYGINGFPSNGGNDRVTYYGGSSGSNNNYPYALSPYLTLSQQRQLAAKLIVLKAVENPGDGPDGVIFDKMYVSKHPTFDERICWGQGNSGKDFAIINDTDSASEIDTVITSLTLAKLTFPGMFNEYITDDGQPRIDISVMQDTEIKIVYERLTSDYPVETYNGQPRKYTHIDVCHRSKKFTPSGDRIPGYSYPITSDNTLDGYDHGTITEGNGDTPGIRLDRSDKLYIGRSSGGYPYNGTLTEDQIFATLTYNLLGGEDDTVSKSGCFCIQLASADGAGTGPSNYPVVDKYTFTNTPENTAPNPQWRHFSNTRIADNNWHHVVVTYAKANHGVNLVPNGSCKIYIDGKLDAEYGSSSYPNVGWNGNVNSSNGAINRNLRIGGVPASYKKDLDTPIWYAGANESANHQWYVIASGVPTSRANAVQGFRGEIGPTHFYEDAYLDESEVAQLYQSLKSRYIFND